MGAYVENFDSMAKTFDTEARIERSKIIADAMLSHVKNGRESTAMEYGCGTALVGMQLAKHFKSIVLADSSEGMIEQVKVKMLEQNLQNASALCCDICEKVPENMKLDYIFMSLVLHHIEDTELAFTRLLSMLNDGGHLLVVDLDIEDGSFHAKHHGFHGHNGFGQAELIEKAKKLGFKNATAETFYLGNKTHEGKSTQHTFFLLNAEK